MRQDSQLRIMDERKDKYPALQNHDYEGFFQRYKLTYVASESWKKVLTAFWRELKMRVSPNDVEELTRVLRDKRASIAKDCDSDTLLIRAIPAGPVCHTGSKTCFNGRETEGFIKELQSVIQGRHKEMPEGSYTTKLFTKGVNKIAQKVGEEAVETVIEAIDGNNERLVYEASDLIYHLLVLLENQGLSIADLEEELFRRHK